MKKFFTTLCCAFMATCGYFITHGGDTHEYNQNSLYAANIPERNYNGQKPIDILLDMAKKMKTDTVYINVYDTITVNNTKYIRVPVPERTTDTLYISTTDLPEIEVAPVKKPIPEDREEGTSGETRDGPNPVIILTIDGKMVYSSGNDILTGSNPQDTTTVHDEP